MTRIEKLLHALVRKKKPTVMDHQTFGWLLGKPLGFTVGLVCWYRSDDCSDHRPLMLPMWAWVLTNGFFEVVFNDNDTKISRSKRVMRSLIPRRYKKHERLNMALFPARTMEERLIDFPWWMSPNDVVRDSERRVWLITILGREPR